MHYIRLTIQTSINDYLCYADYIVHFMFMHFLIGTLWGFMTTLLDIGGMLRKERVKQKLSKVRLAELSNVHRNTILQLESGIGNVELNTLISICNVLGQSIQLVPNAAVFNTQSQLDATQSSLKTNIEARLAFSKFLGLSNE